MAANQKNIIVGAARLFVSYGAGSNRPDLTASAVFPWSVNTNTNTPVASASSTSVPAYLTSTASAYWRELGFTSTGVDFSYEPGYTDVVVDQLLDAARLFQHTLKIVLKTELDEALFENMNFVWGQQEQVINAGSANVTVNTLSGSATATTPGSTTQVNLVAGALGITPVERSLVFVGTAPGSIGLAANYPLASSSAAPQAYGDTSALRSRERAYVARRIIQDQTTAHQLKRDAATVFPVSFRALPDVDRNAAAGSEYGFIIDRVFGTI